MSLPSIDSLRCFDAAARLLRFRAAAKAVALTPAALGHRIRQLEEELGVRLFERTTRTVRLTEAGLALVPHVRACLEAAANCHRVARGELGAGAMDITIGTRHELGISWLTPQLPALALARPQLTLHVYFGSSSDLLLRVRSLEIDCAVTSQRIGESTLDALPIHPEHYVFVGAPKLLSRLPLRREEDAAAHRLIDADVDLPLFRYFRDAPGASETLSSNSKGSPALPFKRVLRVGTIGAIRDLVVAGEGVAVLPLYLVRPDLEAKRLQRLFPKVTPQHDYFRLVFRRDDPRRSIFEILAKDLAKSPLK